MTESASLKRLRVGPQGGGNGIKEGVGCSARFAEFCVQKRRLKFGCLFHLSGNCSLAAFLRKNLRFTMLLRGAFCVELARFACLFFCLFWVKKDGYFSASLCLLTACVFRTWTCDAEDAGGAGG